MLLRRNVSALIVIFVRGILHCRRPLLCSNALKNTGYGGVLLALRERAGRWRIGVWDTVMGIEREHQGESFTEFYCIPRHGTEEGFRLSLAIVPRLTQVLGLAVKTRSQPGRGSVFWIEGKAALPAIATDTVLTTKGLASWPGGWPESDFLRSAA